MDTNQPTGLEIAGPRGEVWDCPCRSRHDVEDKKRYQRTAQEPRQAYDFGECARIMSV